MVSPYRCREVPVAKGCLLEFFLFALALSKVPIQMLAQIGIALDRVREAETAIAAHLWEHVVKGLDTAGITPEKKIFYFFIYIKIILFTFLGLRW